MSSMKAIRYRTYGSPDVLTLEDVDVPTIADDQVLVRVVASSVNPLDWHYVRGKPYVVRLMAGLRRPKEPGLGDDLAGVVVAVGDRVTRFVPGDEVFGMSIRCFAEFVAANERGLVHKPAGLSFEHAAAMGIAAITALQAVRDEGKVQADQRVLINGASGGVGTFAVQIANHFGADVTAVTSTPNLVLVRSIGAHSAIDYTTTDFTRAAERYDVILDFVGGRSLRNLRRALSPTGRLVLCGAPRGEWLGPILSPIGAKIQSLFTKQTLGTFLATRKLADLTLLRDLAESGAITPVIDREFALAELPEALSYLETGRARGKVTITL